MRSLPHWIDRVATRVCDFVVPRDSPGLEPGEKEDKLGQRARDTRIIPFGEARVAASRRFGQEGEGFRIAMETLGRTRPTIGPVAMGTADRAPGDRVE